MKTKIIGWLYIIGSIALLVGSIYLTYISSNEFNSYGGHIQSNIYDTLIRLVYIGYLGCILSIIAGVWACALVRHKKWSWYFGIVFISLLLIGNVVYVVNTFSVIYLIAILFNLFVLYALKSEKSLFIAKPASV